MNKISIKFSKSFKKEYKKAGEKIQKSFEKRLKLFTANPEHPILHHHHLIGDYQNYCSINITGDWRALYRFLEVNGENVVVFEFLGTHSQLYG